MGEGKTAEEYYSRYEGVHVIRDGDQFCARFDDFSDLQESDVGFGNTEAEALVNLALRARHSRAGHIRGLEAVLEILKG